MRLAQMACELGGFRRGRDKDGGGNTGTFGCIMDAEFEGEAHFGASFVSQCTPITNPHKCFS